MSYSWVAGPVMQWQLLNDPTIWNQHLAAVQERATVVDSNIVIGNGVWTGPGAPGVGVSTVIAGTNIQSEGWWASGIAGLVPSIPQYWGMQAGLQLMLGDFINTATVVQGYTTPFGGVFTSISYDMPSARTAAGLPTCYQLPPLIYTDGMGGYTVPNLATLPANSSWRRLRPREVFTLALSPFSENYDLDSNPAVIGQYGWHTVGTGCLLFNCTATGVTATWVQANPVMTGTSVSPVVDPLDNTQNAPNSITATTYGNSFTVNGSFPVSDFTEWFTLCSRGDYISYLLFVEVRAITNLLRWQAKSPTITNISYFAQVVSSISYADALSQMNSAWAPGTPSGGSVIGGSGVGAVILASYDGTNWHITAQRVSTTYALSGLPATMKEMDLYAYGQPCDTIGGASPNDFDAEGDAITNGSYNQIFTSGSPTASTTLSYAFGDATTPPPNAPADPAGIPGNIAQKGYQVLDAMVVVRYDVSGGFVYVF